MLLTIKTTHQPATDLGFLLAKNPAHCQTFPLPFGQAHVFYPVAQEGDLHSSFAGRLGSGGPGTRSEGPFPAGGGLGQYVNDRPYVASSFLSVAIAQVYGSALRGQSKDRPELADTPIALEAHFPTLQCRGGDDFLRRLFEPLGYTVGAERHPTEEFLDQDQSPYYSVTLEGTCRLQELLSHLYVLLPVLDNQKHYWVGQEEIEKLLRQGEGWLASHPEREEIANRYLRHQRRLVRETMARLVADEDPDPDTTEEEQTLDEESLEGKISLGEQRIEAILAILKETGARRILDLGCGEGRLLQALLKEREFERIVGVDVSHRALEIARDRLHLDRLPSRQRERIELFQGALTYRDKRLSGYDSACAVEVIEHIDLPRLPAFERVLFEFARPKTVVITTPNFEYNSLFENLPAGGFRHRDHRFEWTQAEFRDWAQGVCERFGYSVRFLSVGEKDPQVGPPTQMGVFSI